MMRGSFLFTSEVKVKYAKFVLKLRSLQMDELVRYPVVLIESFSLVEREREKGETRSETRPPVADGWAWAEMRVFPL